MGIVVGMVIVVDDLDLFGPIFRCVWVGERDHGHIMVVMGVELGSRKGWGGKGELGGVFVLFASFLQ